MNNLAIPKVILVTGIGTDVGKSYATGWLAKTIAENGESVITQKLIQTGNVGESEDIAVHRKIMGIPMQPRDLDHTTAPLILSYPASPHLAARLDNVDVDYGIATRSTQTLAAEYDHVIVEAAGGIMVPLKEDYLTIDYITDNSLPAAIVVNGALGALNHAILTIEALLTREANPFAVIYNPNFDTDKIIAEENRAYLKRYISVKTPATAWLMMPDVLR